MGAVILRAATCITCGCPMPSAARVDRRYCKGACRTLAYRVRRRVKATRPPGPLEPEWAEPNSVVKTMLTSLAQIQARVLDFAHQLEQQELYARPPVQTQAQRSGAADPPHSDFLEELDAQDNDQDADAADLTAEQVRQSFSHRPAGAEVGGGAELKAKFDAVLRQREQLRTELLDEQAHAQRLSSQLQALQKQTSGASAPVLATDSEARLDEVRRQRDQLEGDLLAERERSGRLDAQLKTVQKEAKEALSRLNYKQATLQHEKNRLIERVNDLEVQFHQANEALTTWERAGAESLAVVDRNSALQQENAALHAEVKRLRPPSADADALVRVMIDRVKSLHWLATYQIQRGVKITGQRLPSYDNEQILVAAQGHAFAARRDYYLTLRGPYHPKPVWIREDYLLDAESEKKVIDEAIFRNRQIVSELEDHRWRVEQKT